MPISLFETWTFKGATLTYTKHKKQFWVCLVFETNNPPKLELGDVLGIDRGIYHLASTSTGQFFSGSKIRASQRRYLHNRRTIQSNCALVPRNAVLRRCRERRSGSAGM